MILITLGTQDKSFERLLNEVKKQIDNNIINEEVIVQAGLTKYKSDKMKIFDFLPSETFNEYMNKANIIITHGGVGSIVSAIKNNKKVIACPRLSKYKEHDNDHQTQICNKLSEDGYLKVLNDGDDLSNILKEIKKFKPKKFISNTNNIINTIENYIDNI